MHFIKALPGLLVVYFIGNFSLLLEMLVGERTVPDLQSMLEKAIKLI